MNADDFNRIAAAQMHESEGEASSGAIQFVQGDDGWMGIHLGGWALDYLDIEAPLILKQNGAEIMLYASDVDTLMELLQRAKFNMGGGA